MSTKNINSNNSNHSVKNIKLPRKSSQSIKIKELKRRFESEKEKAERDKTNDNENKKTNENLNKEDNEKNIEKNNKKDKDESVQERSNVQNSSSIAEKRSNTEIYTPSDSKVSNQESPKNNSKEYKEKNKDFKELKDQKRGSSRNILNPQFTRNASFTRSIYGPHHSRTRTDFYEFARIDCSRENVDFLSDLNTITKEIEKEMGLDNMEFEKEMEKEKNKNNPEFKQKNEQEIQRIKKLRNDIEENSKVQEFLRILYENYFSPKAEWPINIAIEDRKKLDEIYAKQNKKINKSLRDGDLIITEMIEHKEEGSYFHLHHFDGAKNEIEILVKQNTLMRYNQTGRHLRVQSEVKREYEIVTSLVDTLNHYLKDNAKDKVEKQALCCFSKPKYDKKAIYEELENLEQELSKLLKSTLITRDVINTITSAYNKHLKLIGKHSLKITRLINDAQKELIAISPAVSPTKTPTKSQKKTNLDVPQSEKTNKTHLKN